MKTLPDVICNGCFNRDICLVPCKPVEKYINQDYVPQREVPLSTITIDDSHYNHILNSAKICWRGENNYTYDQYQEVCNVCHLTERQAEILYYHMLEGMTHSKIARFLSVSKQYVGKTLDIIANRLNKIT